MDSRTGILPNLAKFAAMGENGGKAVGLRLCVTNLRVGRSYPMKQLANPRPFSANRDLSSEITRSVTVR